jgi:glycosyltransferase involved in cell wall biosynthesis
VRPLALLPFEGPLSRDLRAADVEVLTGPLPVLRRELLSPSGVARLAGDVARARPALGRLIRAQRIDVVHANTSVILGLRAVAPRLVTHVREIYPEVPVAWPLHRRALLRSDTVVCVSEATRRALAAPRARVIHDGLAIDPRRAPRAEARLALGLPQDAFVAAVLGRVSGWKGQEVLARAITEVDNGLCLVAGDAWPGQEHYEDRLREIGGERLRMAGFRDDVETVYGAADVVVVPSTRPDPLPNSALEAAAAGCCVVAANHGGLPEIVHDHRTGRLVPPGDHRALATVLAGLAADPAERERLGAAAAIDVCTRFAPERLARAVEDLYEKWD